MRVIVCGGRDYAWGFPDEAWLDALHARYGFTEVIVGSDTRDAQGHRRGADAYAYAWAARTGIDRTLMDANWTAQGLSAGPRRNGRMLTYLWLHRRASGVEIAVVAFPGGKGTADMVRQAQACHVTVFQRHEEPTP